MKKTLKVLMAIILFAVVLTIATSVSAKTLGGFVTDTASATDAKITYDEANKTYKVEVSNTADPVDAFVSSEALTVEKDTKLDLNGAWLKVPSVTVSNGATLTIAPSQDTNNAGMGVDSKITIAKGATLILDGSSAAFGVKSIVNNGTLIIKDSAATVSEAVDNNGIMYAYVNTIPVVGEDGKGTITPAYTFDDTVEPVAGTDGLKMVPSPDLVEVTVKLLDEYGEEAKTIEAGKEYKIVATTTVDGKPVTEAPTFANDGSDTANYEVNAGKIKFTDDSVVKFTINGVEYTKEVKMGAQGEEPVNPEDPTNPSEPTNPEQPANPADKDLDPDVPNTGDYIIPATAILAVVVVANVVYFAKMKRN